MASLAQVAAGGSVSRLIVNHEIVSMAWWCFLC